MRVFAAHTSIVSLVTENVGENYVIQKYLLSNKSQMPNFHFLLQTSKVLRVEVKIFMKKLYQFDFKR